MKNKILFIFVFISTFTIAQNVAINGTGAAPVASAMLDISSTTSGILIPRMTSVQRTAIAAPATGLRVYDLTTGGFWFFNGVIWVQELNSGLGWLLTGNTLAGTEILGSINAQPVRYFSNNVEHMRMLSTGEIVVNNTVPFAGDLFSVYSTNTSFPINGYVSGAGAVAAGYFENNSTSNAGFGVQGTVAGGSGAAGVRGTGNTGAGNAVTGVGQSSVAFGIRGHNTNASSTGAVISGNGIGASFLTAGAGAAVSGSITGVWGRVTDATGTGGIFSGNAQGATSLIGGSGLAAVGTIIGVVGFSSSLANATLRAGGYF